MLNNFKYAIVWFLISFLFFKFLGWDELAKQREIANWLDIEATVISSKVSLSISRKEYELGIQFEAVIDGKNRIYNCFRNSGPKGQMDKLVATSYAVGKKIQVFINPEDLTEYHFPQRSVGPWIVGFLPGLFFLLIGWSVLRNPRSNEESKC